MNFLATLNTAMVLACLATGCGKQIEIPVSVQAPNIVSQAPVGDDSADPVVPEDTDTGIDVSITVYTKAVTSAPISGWPTKTYSANGYCAVYTGETYCWDDGIKTLAWVDPIHGTNYGPYTYTYWRLGKTGSGSYSVGGNTGMVQDTMVIPRRIAAGGFIAASLGYAPSTVNTVLTTGGATTYDCVDTDGIVDCGNFVIDTTQSSL